MLNIRNKAMLPLLIGGLLIALPACAGSSGGGNGESKGSGGGSPAAGSASDAPPAPLKEPVEIVFKDVSFGWTPEKFMDNYGNAIAKKFPHVTVKALPYAGQPGGMWIPELIAAGQPIDILFSSGAAVHGNILANKLQYDMTPLIKKYKYDLNRLEPSAVALAMQLANGGIYGLPGIGAASPLVYNKDIFDKFGVPYPKDGMNWDEFYELARKLTRTENGIQYRGAIVNASGMILRNPFSLGFIDPSSEKANFQNDNWKVLFDKMASIYKIPGNELTAAQVSVAEQRKLWEKDKTVAMYLPISGSGASELTFAGMNYDFVSMPTFKELPNVGPQPYSTAFYISVSSKHKDQAFEILQYLTSDEFQMEKSKQGTLTVLKSQAVRDAFGKDLPAFTGKNLKALLPEKFAPAPYQSQYNGTAFNELIKGFNNLILGKQDVNTAIRQAEEETNKKIAEDKAKVK
ncbi:extracellular solute-binding protein [Paenibacillus mesophilus]|uniref:ABC transporter substrate-binding protein n=1 Tax=Paenibacillus mesophilus TaxID=2582849 RepID=UPI00110DE253|nr:extracellular solute-binding protein [Paenibacillus mesophilus]TMV48924.1 extracellular solute-binding protein [Paenibacillus mesophilus]